MDILVKEYVKVILEDDKTRIGNDGKADSSRHCFLIYKNKTDNDLVFELRSDVDICSIYRLKIHANDLDKLRREQNHKITLDDEALLKFIKDFVQTVDKKSSLRFEASQTSGKLILMFMEKGATGFTPSFRIPMSIVKGEELMNFLADYAQTYKKERDFYRSKVEKFEQRLKKMDKLQEDYQRMKDENERLERNLRNEKQNAEEKIQRLEDRLSVVEEENRVNDEDADKLKEENDSLKAQLADRERMIEELEDETNKIRTSRDKYEAAATKLYKKGAKTEKMYLEKLAEYECLEAKKEQYKTAYHKERQLLDAKIAEYDSLLAVVKEKDEEIATLKSDIEILTNKLEVQNKIVEELQNPPRQKSIQPPASKPLPHFARPCGKHR